MQKLGHNGRGVKSKSATPHQQTDDASRGNRMMDNLLSDPHFCNFYIYSQKYEIGKQNNRESACIKKNSIKSS